MDLRVEGIVATVRQNPESVSGPRDLSRSVNLSTSRFYVLFRAEMSMSPARYVKSARMDAAKELLETTFLSIKEVVAQVGFKDQSHFVRDFKERYGLGPTEYR